LRASLLGDVLVPGDPGYDHARRVWNGIIDRYPALIVRCSGVSDVVEAVGFARRHPMPLSIRGGGHQVAGSAVCDDGLVIDLSTMNAVHVDPVARTARVQAGARWADVDRTTQLFGLATTGGEASITGVAGLTLGGGMGMTQRAFGLACDNLRSIELVTADGVVRTASRHDHPDLFWAARGAGRGLGVVTSFEFELHPLGPDVAVAQVAYAYDDAQAVLRAWRDLALAAPETVSPEAGFWSLPADPELPTELHGAKILLVSVAYVGDPADADAVLAPFRTLATPLIDMSATMPYVAVQSASDPIVPDGGRYYFKSHFMDELTDDAIAAMTTCDAARPTGETLIILRTLGGAIDRVPADESAYPHRGARFNLSIDGIWSDLADDAATIGWVRHTWNTMRPFANGGVYLNFAGFDDEADITTEALLGPNTARLEKVRADYDPDGLFSQAAARR
jgi:FAD/FMN-containing dehydrogenase